MEIPMDVLVYIDQIAGEAKQARLLASSPHGFYEVILQLAGGPRRALLPIAKTFILATELEASGGQVTEVER